MMGSLYVSIDRSSVEFSSAGFDGGWVGWWVGGWWVLAGSGWWVGDAKQVSGRVLSRFLVATSCSKHQRGCFIGSRNVRVDRTFEKTRESRFGLEHSKRAFVLQILLEPSACFTRALLTESHSLHQAECCCLTQSREPRRNE